jgi:hypothetical protein
MPIILHGRFQINHAPLEAPQNYLDKYSHVNDTK